MTTARKVPSFLRVNRFPASAAAPFLQASKATLPRRVEGYFHRPRLVERCQPLDTRLAVLQAPCGFGKTALLNDICHRERDRGAVVAWLRTGEEISGDLLLDYLAYAFVRGGLELSSLRHLWTDDRRSRQTGYRAGLLMRAIENYGKPCLLVLDEVERLDSAGAVAIVDLLLRRGPRNLHFAMAMRSNPRGLDLATAILDRRGSILAADDLRFSYPEIALFMGSPLTREQLASAAERTEGWPAALRMHRTLAGIGEGSGALSERSSYREMAAEFLGARLMRDLDGDSREFLLDVALFDTFDPSLMDEVLPGERFECRTEVLSNLHGLFRPVDPGGQVLRLHPMVREYLRLRRLREDAGRFRQSHRRLATAMLRRGNLNDALRHAGETGDAMLWGRILEESGALSLVLKVGVEQFLNTSRHLGSELCAVYPRLALMRCIALVLEGSMDDAWALFERVRKSTRNFEQDREGGDFRALRVEGAVARSVMSACACRSIGDAGVSQSLEEVASLAQDDGLPPALRGSLYAVLAVADHQLARFELSRRRGTRAKEYFVLSDSVHGRGLIDVQGGVVAMAQGRVHDAMAAYTRNGPTTIAKILLAELHIERNRNEFESAWTAEECAGLHDVRGWFDVHAAAHGNRVALAFESAGFDAALGVLEDSLRRAARGNLPSLERLLSAQRVSYLAAAGQSEAARRAWDSAGLPERLADQLNLDRQSWREMEAIACARIGLLGAEGDFDTARRVASNLRNTARARGLTRTLMRCLAEWIGLECRATNLDGAVARLQEFLDRFRLADYSRPLMRDRRLGVRVLRRLLDTELDSDTRGHAESLLDELGEPGAPEKRKAPSYTVRETDVVHGLIAGQRDKEIARRLGLTENGVRYHLKKIYRKMGAAGRVDAVRYARSQGIV